MRAPWLHRWQQVSRQLSPALPPYLVLYSITPGVAWNNVLQAGSVLSHQRTPAAAQLNRGLGSALHHSSALCGK